MLHGLLRQVASGLGGYLAGSLLAHLIYRYHYHHP